MLDAQPTGGQPGKADLNKVFDLDRKQLTRKMVDRYEEVLRQQESARSDMKLLTEECVEAQFKPRDIKAMKKIAQLRVKDQALQARGQLEALNRIGGIVGMDLFEWSDLVD